LHLLIDSDPMIYASGFAAERMEHKIYVKGEEDGGVLFTLTGREGKKEAEGIVEKDPSLYLVSERNVEPVSHAIQILNTSIKNILKVFPGCTHQCYLTGKGNFREEVATIKKYKGNRKPEDKPTHYKDLRRYLVDKWEAIVVDGCEADDAVSLEQYKSYYSGEFSPEGHCDTCIVSIDKDLNQVPGWHYNPTKKEKYWITEEEGIKNFYTQLLTGDATDNIQGIPGIGPKRAAKLLEGCDTEKSMYDKCSYEYGMYALEHYEGDDGAPDAYEKASNRGDFELRENARLLWMAREEIDDWKAPE